MSFTTLLFIHLDPSFPLPATGRSVEAITHDLSTTIDSNGNAFDHDRPVEAITVPLTQCGNELRSHPVAFMQDLGFFDVTHADFPALSVRVPMETGFLFRSGKLQSMPGFSNGDVGLDIWRRRRTFMADTLQAKANSKLPYPLTNLPPGFSGIITSATITLVSGAISLTLMGTVSPPAPPAPPALPQLPSIGGHQPPKPIAPPPALPAPAPVAFTAMDTLTLAPALDLHNVHRFVVATAGTATMVFTGATFESRIAATILNAVSSLIAASMVDAIEAEVERLLHEEVCDPLVTPMPVGSALPGTCSIQAITITPSGIIADGAFGRFISVPIRQRRPGDCP